MISNTLCHRSSDGIPASLRGSLREFTDAAARSSYIADILKREVQFHRGDSVAALSAIRHALKRLTPASSHLCITHFTDLQDLGFPIRTVIEIIEHVWADIAASPGASDDAARAAVHHQVIVCTIDALDRVGVDVRRSCTPRTIRTALRAVLLSARVSRGTIVDALACVFRAQYAGIPNAAVAALLQSFPLDAAVALVQRAEDGALTGAEIGCIAQSADRWHTLGAHGQAELLAALPALRGTATIDAILRTAAEVGVTHAIALHAHVKSSEIALQLAGCALRYEQPIPALLARFARIRERSGLSFRDFVALLSAWTPEALEWAMGDHASADVLVMAHGRGWTPMARVAVQVLGSECIATHGSAFLAYLHHVCGVDGDASSSVDIDRYRIALDAFDLARGDHALADVIRAFPPATRQHPAIRTVLAAYPEFAADRILLIASIRLIRSGIPMDVDFLHAVRDAAPHLNSVWLHVVYAFARQFVAVEGLHADTVERAARAAAACAPKVRYRAARDLGYFRYHVLGIARDGAMTTGVQVSCSVHGSAAPRTVAAPESDRVLPYDPIASIGDLHRMLELPSGLPDGVRREEIEMLITYGFLWTGRGASPYFGKRYLPERHVLANARRKLTSANGSVDPDALDRAFAFLQRVRVVQRRVKKGTPVVSLNPHPSDAIGIGEEIVRAVLACADMLHALTPSSS